MAKPRTPKPLFEKIKLPLILAAYIAVSEWADPFPFNVSLPARIAVALLILFVLRELHHARLEVDEDWAGRTAKVEGRLRELTGRVNRRTWLRLQRVAVWAVGFLAFGTVINSLTDRCDTAVQCGVLAPRLAIENLPVFLRFAVFVSLTLFQLAIMFWALMKVGSYKLVMPGTIDVRWDDVYGQDAPKQKVMEQVRLLEDSEAVEKAGGFMPKGVLLYGPPGTGKTYLAKAAAGESSKPLILVPPGAFQPQPYSATVWTSDGPRKMGEIKPGDFVLDGNGESVRVVGVQDFGVQPTSRLVFDDGASTRCHIDHKWLVITDEGETVLSVAEMQRRGLTRPHGRNRDSWRFKVRLAGTAQFGSEGPRDLPLHPYVLGVLLGDGTVKGSSVTLACSKYPEIVERVKRLLPEWVGPHVKENAGNPGQFILPVVHHIVKHIGLWGRGVYDKFIPERYLLANADARLELLRGLMDADGCATKDGYGYFNSRSQDLAGGVEFLARSLGGKAHTRSYEQEGATMHQVDVRTPDVPFSVQAKVERWRPFADRRRLSHSLVAIEDSVPEEIRCLQVASDDHLYLTDDFLPTRNSTFVGINLLKVWMLFRHVRKLARRYGGVIVFIDEIDSLGSRGGRVEGAVPARVFTPGCVRHELPQTSEPRRIVIGTQMGTLEAFLSAMDGMEEPRGMLNRLLVFCGFNPLKPYSYKYMLLAATNMPDLLDPALLRAGRFGRKIHVDFPKLEGRLHTYQGYLGKVPHKLTDENVEWAARNHAKGTGAEIKDIVNEALLVTFRNDRPDPGVVRFDDLMHAMLWVKYGESEGPFEREMARWHVAVHEAGHAVAFHFLCYDRERIWFASIDRRGRTGGMVAPTPLHDDWMQTRDELLADIQVSLASRVAEELVLGVTTNGHAGDAEYATSVAQQMVAYGHSGQIGVYDVSQDEVREHTEQILREALDGCRSLLADRKGAIVEVARLLMEKRTVPGDAIHRMLEVS